VPRFHYRALRAGGGEVAGELVAADERDAAARLQEEGSYPIEITDVPDRIENGRRLRSKGKRLASRELVLFTRQLATLLAAGVVLDRALRLVAEGQGRPVSRGLAADLLAAVNRGESLSRACSGHPQLPEHYATIVAASEARGDIGAGLERLADVLERSRATSRALLDALIYPATVLVVAAVSIGFLLGFVLPRFAVLLDSLQRDPPLAMSLLMGISSAFQVLFLPVAVVLAAGALFVAARYRDQAFRLAVHRLVLHLPWLGPLIGKLEAERLLYLLGNLIAAGIALPAAIVVTRSAMASEAFRAGLVAAEAAIDRGDSISTALQASETVPEMAIELVRIGEETGDAAPMLLKAGDLLRREFEASSRELIGIITPVSIVLLGLLIGTVAAAILGGLMDVYDLAP
jgi:general secretion pathway protein F